MKNTSMYVMRHPGQNLRDAKSVDRANDKLAQSAESSCCCDEFQRSNGVHDRACCARCQTKAGNSVASIERIAQAFCCCGEQSVLIVLVPRARPDFDH